MIAAGTALAGALVLAMYPALVAPGVAALPLIAAAAVVALAAALALALAVAVPGAIALLGCELLLALAARHEAGSFTAAIYGAALLLVAELAFLSIQLKDASRAESSFFRRYVVRIVGIVLFALAIVGMAAVVSSVPLSGGLPLLVAGVCAVIVTIAIVVALVWRSDMGRP